MLSFRTLASLCFLGATAWAQSSAQPSPSATFLSGPYVTHITPTSATVLWITDEWFVRSGSAPGKRRLSGPSFKVNQAALANLNPATTYSYDVPGAGRCGFTTPPNGHGGFTFAVYGDVRTRHDVHRRVVHHVLPAGRGGRRRAG